jgi:Protein of unknown function (DUF1566)
MKRGLMRATGRSRTAPRLGVAALALVVSASAPRLVRADAPAGRYTITGGTVFDTKTKLTWQQAVSSGQISWANAKTFCATLGGGAWRMPTIKELLTIIDHTRASGPFIDQTAFPSAPGGAFWSLTTQAGIANAVWVVDFDTGVAAPSATTVPNQRPVRCVR